MGSINQKLSFDTVQLLGVGFVVVWAIDFVTKAYWFGIGSYQFLFFCSSLLLAGGLALIYRNREMAAAVLGMLLVLQLPWLVDIAWIIFAGYSINGSADYVFGINQPQYLITLRHFFMIPAMAYGFSRLPKIKNKEWSASSIAAGLFSAGIALSVLFAPVSEDINYTGNSNHALISVGSPFLNQVVFFGMVLVVICIVARGIASINPSHQGWNKAIKFFVWAYLITGTILSAAGYKVLY